MLHNGGEEVRSQRSVNVWIYLIVALALVFGTTLALIDVYSYRSARDEVFDVLHLAETVVQNQNEEIRSGQREVLRLKKLRDEALRAINSRETSEQTFRNFTSLLEGYPGPDHIEKEERAQTLERALRRLREKEKEFASRKEVRVTFYSPQPRTNRHGTKQSLYPHDVYNFWHQPLVSSLQDGEEWVEWDCDGGVKCLYGEGISKAQDADAVLFFFPKTFRTPEGKYRQSKPQTSSFVFRFLLSTLTQRTPNLQQ